MNLLCDEQNNAHLLPTIIYYALLEIANKYYFSYQMLEIDKNIYTVIHMHSGKDKTIRKISKKANLSKLKSNSLKQNKII